MAQAILILAHKDYAQVKSLVKYLNHDFNVYVHFDTKMILTAEQQAEFNQLANVNWISQYNCKWGAYSIVQATVALFKVALANPDNQYFHLLSAQDWPTHHPKVIFDFYDGQQQGYMNFYPAKGVTNFGEPLIWWMKYYYNYDQLNRRTKFGKIYHRVLNLVETVLRVDKLTKLGLSEEMIYAGQQWVDLPREMVAYAITEMEINPIWERLFKNSFCPDEFWLSTILANSQYQQQINKQLYRYIVWERRNGSRPANLDLTDYDPIVTGDYFWARKMDVKISEPLIDKLTKHNEREENTHDKV